MFKKKKKIVWRGWEYDCDIIEYDYELIGSPFSYEEIENFMVNGVISRYDKLEIVYDFKPDFLIKLYYGEVVILWQFTNGINHFSLIRNINK